MFDVNLYVETNHQKYPKKRKRCYIYVLEYIRPDEDPHIRGHLECREEVSARQIALMAMVHAVRRINRPSEIHIYTGCSEIFGTDWINWLHGWKENGFLTAQGKPPVNCELWKQLGDMLDSHYINVDGMGHSYKSWMVTEMERSEREGISQKSYDRIPGEERELERAKREARSLDPDRRKWPPGLVPLNPDVHETAGRRYLYQYYRDDRTEDEEFRYRYHSEPCPETVEAGCRHG